MRNKEFSSPLKSPLFSLLGFLLVCVATSGSYAHANASRLGKSFVYCSEGSPRSFNPQIATDGASYNAGSRTVYNRLVEFADGSTEIEPGLAESWKIAKDGLSYQFKLRKGVKFHSNEKFSPKRDFNADDVLFSFNRQGDVNHPYHKVGGGSYEYYESMEMKSLIKSLTKIDDYTVKFELNKTEAPFMANLAMDFASIFSAEYAEEMMKKGTPQEVDNFPIGTGPFMFLSYKKDNMIRFASHPQYFKGKVKIDNLIFVITPDASVRFQKLKTGECQLIAEPSPVDLKQMQSMEKLKVMEKEGLNIGYLAMNTNKGPFKNILVREAIHHALNRKSYLEAIYLNHASMAKIQFRPPCGHMMRPLKIMSMTLKRPKSYW